MLRCEGGNLVVRESWRWRGRGEGHERKARCGAAKKRVIM